MFSLKHFIWIGLCIGFVLMMDYISLKKKFSLKTAGYIMTVICGLSETSKIMSYMIESEYGGMVLDPLALPFHLCSMMLFGIIYITFGKDGDFKDKLMDFMGPMAILGSIMAIMIPTDGVEFNNILVYQGFIYHAGLLWFGTYLIIFKYAHMNLKTYFGNIGILLMLTLFNIYMNSILSIYGTNFMFLVRPPLEGLPLLNLNHGWYMYFVTVVLLALIIITIFYLPFILCKRKSVQ